MARLRGPGGCPWDREQDHLTLRRYAVEEAYELLDAIEGGNDAEIADELGDFLLQVVFHCQMAAERGAFDFDAVCQGQVDKLIRRHPHVFGGTQAETSDAVISQWERIKQAEKKDAPPKTVLERIPRHLPALLQAEKFLKKTRKLTAPESPQSEQDLSGELIRLVEKITAQGLSAEELLRAELKQLDEK